MEYDNSNEIKAGLWEKTSKKGHVYAGGKVRLGGQDYWITQFAKNSDNPKAPLFELIFKPAEAYVPADVPAEDTQAFPATEQPMPF